MDLKKKWAERQNLQKNYMNSETMKEVNQYSSKFSIF